MGKCVSNLSGMTQLIPELTLILLEYLCAKLLDFCAFMFQKKQQMFTFFIFLILTWMVSFSLFEFP